MITRYYTAAKDVKVAPVEIKDKKETSWTNTKKYGHILLSWSIYYFAYYGLQYSMNWMGDVILLNFTLFGIIELIGIYMGTRLLKEFKVFVMPMRWLLFFGGLACLVFHDQTTTSFFLAVLCQLKSRQIGDHSFLPVTDDLHYGNFSDQKSVTGVHFVLFCRKVGSPDFRRRPCR